MPEEHHRWIVDVLDAHAATVEVDGEQLVTLPRWLLPAEAREGDVLSVRHERDAHASRLVVQAAPAETAAAIQASRDQLASAPRDPSTGDIAL